MCKGKHLGHHATEEAAVQARDNYVKDGVVPDHVTHRAGTSSHFKGVSWVKLSGKWHARCKGKSLRLHATEEAAAQAYDNYVKDGVVPVQRRERREGTSSQFQGVGWDKKRGKWRAECKKKLLGHHATEEAAARAYDNYDEDGVVPVQRQAGTSQFKGVSWHKTNGKWRANCKGNELGYHATEEAAARAYNTYVKDGVVPAKKRREGTSEFKGVFWDKRNGKWAATCKRKHLGYHTTEEAAARAYVIEAESLGLPLNVDPPAGNTDDGNAAAPAARALLSTAASTHTHAAAGSKRVGAPTTSAAPKSKKLRMDTSAGAAAGGCGGTVGGGGAGQC